MIFFMTKKKFEEKINEVVDYRIRGINEKMNDSIRRAILDSQLRNDIQKVIDDHNWVFDKELKEKIKGTIESNRVYAPIFNSISERYSTSSIRVIEVSYHHILISTYDYDSCVTTLTFSQS